MVTIAGAESTPTSDGRKWLDWMILVVGKPRDARKTI